MIYFTYSRYHAKLKSTGAGVPAEETAAAFSGEVRVALGRLGMGESQMRGFAAGNAVSFFLPSAAKGTVTIARAPQRDGCESGSTRSSTSAVAWPIS